MACLEFLLRALKAGIRKDLSPREGLTAYQLVGEVTAHQGDDG